LKLAALLAAALVAGSAVRVWNAGQTQVNAAHNPAVQLFEPSTLVPGYAIPETVNTVGHWNANDLNNATARVGTAWTKVGSVTFTPGSPSTLNSVGPFSLTKYFTKITNPLTISSGPFMGVIVLTGTSPATQQIVFSEANTAMYLQVAASDFNLHLPSGNINETFASGVAVLVFGQTAGGTVYFQVNGGSTGTTTSSFSATTGPAYLGTYNSAYGPWSGTVNELELSRDVPSPAAFTAIYNATVARL
jgi:hypothetical protein